MERDGWTERVRGMERESEGVERDKWTETE